MTRHPFNLLRPSYRWFAPVLLTLAFLPVTVAATDEHAVLEYQVKAAYVCNFARYVEWPASTFAATEAPIRIAVLGSDLFRRVLRDTATGRIINGRPLVIARYDFDQSADRYQILVIEGASPGTSARVQHRIDRQPVLSVGETATCMIRFRVLDGVIRFTIDNVKVENSGLRISSRLLQLSAKPRVVQRAEATK